MKTLKMLIVSEKELDNSRKLQFEQARTALEMYSQNKLKVEFDYRVNPLFFFDAVVENGTDLDEHWIQSKLKDYKYHIVHVDVSDTWWKALGLKDTLYGQSQVVKTELGLQGIQYGRWTDSIGSRVLRFMPAHLKWLSSLAIGVWHETDHTVRGLLGLDTHLTHYHFYGLKTNSRDAIRYERTPDPDIGWGSLPFERLYDLDYLKKREIVNLLQKVVGLYKLMLAPKSKYPTGVQPLVQRKANALMQKMLEAGDPVRIVEGLRSCERQDQLYAQGRTTAGNIVTNARCGESLHQYGVAVDFVFLKDGYNASEKRWLALGKAGEALGFSWGGRWTGFVDKPHFEMTLGYSLKDFQDGKVDYKKFN